MVLVQNAIVNIPEPIDILRLLALVVESGNHQIKEIVKLKGDFLKGGVILSAVFQIRYLIGIFFLNRDYRVLSFVGHVAACRGGLLKSAYRHWS